MIRYTDSGDANAIMDFKRIETQWENERLGFRRVSIGGSYAATVQQICP